MLLDKKIIDTKTFADLDSITSELSTKPFSGDDLLDAIRADNTLEQLTGIIIKTQNMPDTPQVRGYVADNLKKSKELNDLLTFNQIFIDRTANVGILPPDTAINYGISGPNLHLLSWDKRL